MLSENALTFLIRADGSQAKGELASVRAAVTKEVRSIGEGFGSQLPVIGRFSSLMSPTALGVAAVGVAAVGTVAGIAALAKEAAAAGSRFNDLSLASGLSVETLSGLDLQLTQSGASLEALTNGLFILQKNQAAASGGNKQLASTFQQLGVDTKATSEDALRQFIAGLNKIPDASERNAAGARVMGRSYKELAVFIKDANGDIDSIIEKSRAAGRVMTTAAAVAADVLGDKMDELSYSLTAAGRAMIMPALPALVGALNDVTSASSGTASGLRAIGQAIASIIDGGRIAAGVLKAIADNDIYRIPSAIEAIRKEQRGRVIDDLAGTGGAVLGRTLGGGRGDFDFGAGKGGGSANSERAAQLAEETRGIEREYKRQTEIIQREQDLQLSSLRDATTRTIQAENDRYDALKEKLDDQLALAKKGSEREKIRGDIREAELARDKNIQAAKDAQYKQERTALEAHTQAMLKRAEQYDADRIATIQAQAELRAKTHERAEEQIVEIESNAFKRRLDYNRAQIKALQTLAGFQFDAMGNVIEDEKAQARLNLEELQKLQDEGSQIIAEWDSAVVESERRRSAARKKDLEEARAWAREMRELEYSTLYAALDVGQMKIDAMRRNYESRQAIAKAQAEHDAEQERIRHERTLKEIADEEALTLTYARNAEERLEIQRRYNEQRELEEERHRERNKAIKDQEKTDSGEGGIFDGLKKEMSDLPTFTEAISSTLVGMWRSVSGAIGDTIKNYVLFGKVSGQAVRKAVAEALAATAVEMAVLSLKHLGLGFAALTPWGAALYGPASNQFKAAGFFAAAAVAAAGAGRLVAGNSFQQQSGGGGGSAAGGNDSGGLINRDRSNEPAREIARPVQRHAIDITIKDEDGRVLAKVTDALRNNGNFRDEVRDVVFA